MFPVAYSSMRRRGAAAAIKRVRSAGRKLPDEIAFLAGNVPDIVLETAAARARRLGVDADRLLISEGAIDEDEFYMRLAAHLGAEFTRTPRCPRADADWRMALAAGTAHLDDGRWLVAPRGRAIAALLQRLSPDRDSRLVVTTPSAFERLLAEAFASEIAIHAAQGLGATAPHFSARFGATQAQKVVFWSLLCLTPVGVAHASAFWGLLLLPVAALMLVAVCVRLLAVLASMRPRPEPPALTDERLPSYTILVALYREVEVAPRLVSAMRQLDYPAGKLEVVFLVEREDCATMDALAEEDLPGHFRIFSIPDGAPRTKPRALNVGLLVARGELLVVYDAEDRPEPDQLRKAAAQFLSGGPDLACLQASLRIENRADSWLTRLFALDYAGQFEVLLRGMSAMRLPLPLGGSSNHFRTDILRATGGWDAWNVTEDADLGLRLARLGYRCETLDSATWEEAPALLRDWFPQRRRWLKGWMQTLATHSRRPLRLVSDLGPCRATHAISLLASNTFGPAIGLWFTLYVLHDAYFGDLLSESDPMRQFLAWSWTMLAGLGALSIVAPTAVAIVKAGLLDCAPFLFLRPLHWLLVSCAGLAAAIELWRKPFHWSKTRHGLSKSLVDGVSKGIS